MSIVGTVSFESEGHRLVLLTPSGRSRDYDIVCKAIWFHVAGLGHPHKGLVVEFDVDHVADGFEAVNVRSPRLQPLDRLNGTRAVEDGAAPAAVTRHAAAGEGIGEC